MGLCRDLCIILAMQRTQTQIWRLDTLDRVNAIFTMEMAFVTYRLLFCTSCPPLKRAYFKMNEFALVDQWWPIKVDTVLWEQII